MASNPTYDFSGQVALITGAGSGMGLATARTFAQAGAAVVMADINPTTLHAATDILRRGRAGPRARPTANSTPLKPWRARRGRWRRHRAVAATRS